MSASTLGFPEALSVPVLIPTWKRRSACGWTQVESMLSGPLSFSSTPEELSTDGMGLADWQRRQDVLM